MPETFQPWISYPSLTVDRLTRVASIMRDARDGAALLHDIEAGDSNWSLGCRVYSRIMAGLRRDTLLTPWLTVLPETHALRFTFTIGAIPVKFYKGVADDVPTKHLNPSFAELRQLNLAFKVDGISPTNLLRIAIEADGSGKTTAVSLVEVEESGEPVRVFQIPLDAANVLVMKSKPINLDPPTLGIKNVSAGEKAVERAEGQFGSSDKS